MHQVWLPERLIDHTIMDQIRERIAGRMKLQEVCDVLQHLWPRTYSNRNQQISSFTDIINPKLDLNWTKRQINPACDIGKRQVNRPLSLIDDDNRRKQSGRSPL
jgi:hypothetical protein